MTENLHLTIYKHKNGILSYSFFLKLVEIFATSSFQFEPFHTSLKWVKQLKAV
jgi:hypothetical protein